MARRVTETEADIQALEPADKERLLEFLLDDVGPADPEIDRAWLEEVQRRSRELDEGKVTAVSWDQVAVDVRARLRKLRV
jgi:putative addiction module component (TIGR02574 family)